MADREVAGRRRAISGAARAQSEYPRGDHPSVEGSCDPGSPRANSACARLVIRMSAQAGAHGSVGAASRPDLSVPAGASIRLLDWTQRRQFGTPGHHIGDVEQPVAYPLASAGPITSQGLSIPLTGLQVCRLRHGDRGPIKITIDQDQMLDRASDDSVACCKRPYGDQLRMGDRRSHQHRRRRPARQQSPQLRHPTGNRLIGAKPPKIIIGNQAAPQDGMGASDRLSG